MVAFFLEISFARTGLRSGVVFGDVSKTKVMNDATVATGSNSSPSAAHGGPGNAARSFSVRSIEDVE